MKFYIKNCSKYLFLALAISIFAASCSDHNFKVKGEIYGGEEKSIVLEKSDFNGNWIPVDSTRINKNGGFSFAFPSPSSPEIFRLALNNQYVYFPIDSTETITVSSSFDKFGNDFSLTGSTNAQNLGSFEKELQNADINNPEAMHEFKRNVYSKFMKDAPGSIVSFYILTKTVNGIPIYDTSLPNDRKYFGAVANGFKTMKPNDPHTALLERVAIQALKMKNSEAGNYKTIEANEISLIDIDLQDEYGKNVKLSDIAGHGKPVVVIFSLLNQPESPELNIQLAQIYNRHKDKVEFYNVSLDSDQYAWRDAAKNLPWITVYSPGQGASDDARKYNAYQLPAYFIYNADGELTKRPLSLEELDKAL